ncbi:PAS domain S-box protein [Billgrantia lactosivorans]|uniref:PAS domain S-box protein n=1 Tax=Billgrantia lactosivorans TaxID=2185141 RepID=UPI001FE94650|nr:PAS domain S-box protein [Halomonas lactosivorans]
MRKLFGWLYRWWQAMASRRGYGKGDTRFRALLESLPNVAVQGYDRDRRVIYWNAASTRLYGYTAEEAAGRYLEELIIPDAMQARVTSDHAAWLSEGKVIPPGRLVLRDKLGRAVPVYSYHVMLDEGTDEPVMFCVDVRLDIDEAEEPASQLPYTSPAGLKTESR